VVLAPIEIATCARMFLLWSIETAPAHKGTIAVSDEDDIFSAGTSRICRARKNQNSIEQTIARAKNRARSDAWTCALSPLDAARRDISEFDRTNY